MQGLRPVCGVLLLLPPLHPQPLPHRRQQALGVQLLQLHPQNPLLLPRLTLVCGVLLLLLPTPLPLLTSLQLHGLQPRPKQHNRSQVPGEQPLQLQPPPPQLLVRQLSPKQHSLRPVCGVLLLHPLHTLLLHRLRPAPGVQPLQPLHPLPLPRLRPVPGVLLPLPLHPPLSVQLWAAATTTGPPSLRSSLKLPPPVSPTPPCPTQHGLGAPLRLWG